MGIPEYQVRKLYKGCAELKDYEVKVIIKWNLGVNIKYQQEVKYYTPEQCIHYLEAAKASWKDGRNIIQSKFNPDQKYGLVKFTWNRGTQQIPIDEFKEQKLIDAKVIEKELRDVKNQGTM